MKPKVKKIYGLSLKASIIVLAYGFIYIQIFHTKETGQAIHFIHKLLGASDVPYILLLVFLLMLLNWGLEAWKWKYLINKIETVSFTKSFKAVLTGVTISSFTPNRIGDYLGRVFILEKANHFEGIFATLIGSLGQLVANLMTGTVFTIIFVAFYVSKEWIHSGIVLSGILFTGALLLALLPLIYFNISILSKLAHRIKPNKWGKFHAYIRIFSRYSNHELSRVFLLSLVRNFVFTIQYYLLLALFKVPVSFAEGVMLVSVIFFVMTAIPTIALAEIGVRGTTAMIVFGLFFQTTGLPGNTIEISILAASTVLWFINLIIPAICGGFFIFELTFFRIKKQ